MVFDFGLFVLKNRRFAENKLLLYVHNASELLTRRDQNENPDARGALEAKKHLDRMRKL